MRVRTAAVKAAFRSMRHRNARLFFIGLFVSSIGQWIYITALSILLDRLTGQTTTIGVMMALQFTPMLLLGAYGGAIADQFNRLKLVKLTQLGMTLQAVAIAVVDLTGVVNVPIVYGLSIVLGLLLAFDNPARRGFVTELVPDEDVANAISLSTAVMTGSRIIGPAIAALLIGPLGTGWLFILNAVSFVVILVSLAFIRGDELFTTKLTKRGGTPVRDVVVWMRNSPVLWVPFVTFAVVAASGFNYGVILPRLAREVWGAEQWFGWVLTTLSIGSLFGSLMTASLHKVRLRWVFATGMLLVAGTIALSWSPSGWVALLTAVPVGMGSAAYVTSVNALTQQECPADMRARVLAMVAVAFLGSYPIGGPLTGLAGDHIGLAWALTAGAVIAGTALLSMAWWALGRQPGVGRMQALRGLRRTSGA